MNILTDEEISLMAHNIGDADWNDINCRDCWHDGFKVAAREVEAAIMSKLAEQDVEPVAWKDTCLTIDELEQHHTEPVLLGYKGWEILPDGIKLYTEAQLIAAQASGKPAEACAKVCESNHDKACYDQGYHPDGYDLSKAIRNGEWRIYL